MTLTEKRTQAFREHFHFNVTFCDFFFTANVDDILLIGVVWILHYVLHYMMDITLCITIHDGYYIATSP